MGAARKAMIVNETEDSEGDEIASACIIEEVNLGKAIRLAEEKPSAAREAKNAVVLDTGCTSSVAGDPWLREYMDLDIV